VVKERFLLKGEKMKQKKGSVCPNGGGEKRKKIESGEGIREKGHFRLLGNQRQPPAGGQRTSLKNREGGKKHLKQKKRTIPCANRHRRRREGWTNLT